jgi:hypothetical protein
MSLSIYNIFDELKSINLELKLTLEESILLEPQIWSRCCESVIKSYLKAASGLLHGSHKIVYWMDCVEQFYFESEEAWCFVKEAILGANLEGLERISESLWCCINSPTGYHLFEFINFLDSTSHPLIDALFANHGIDIIFRFVQSAHERIQISGFKLLQSPKCVNLVKDTSPYKWIDILGYIRSSLPFYLQLHCFAFGATFSFNDLGGNLPIENVSWLTVIFGVLSINLPSSEIIDLVLETWNTSLNGSSSNALLITSELMVSSIMDVLRKLLESNYSVTSKTFQQLIVLLVSFLLQNDDTIAKGLNDVFIEIFLLYEKDIAVRLLAVILDEFITRLTLDLPLYPILCLFEIAFVIDQVLFYYKDIILAFEDTYGDAIGNFGLLMDFGKLFISIRFSCEAPAL